MPQNNVGVVDTALLQSNLKVSGSLVPTAFKSIGCTMTINNLKWNNLAKPYTYINCSFRPIHVGCNFFNNYLPTGTTRGLRGSFKRENVTLFGEVATSTGAKVPG